MHRQVRELHVLRRLSHPNICRFLGFRHRLDTRTRGRVIEIYTELAQVASPCHPCPREHSHSRMFLISKLNALAVSATTSRSCACAGVSRQESFDSYLLRKFRKAAWDDLAEEKQFMSLSVFAMFMTQVRRPGCSHSEP
jgi:hypothetical protein